METITRRAFALWLTAPFCRAAGQKLPSASFFQQAAAQTLQRNFPDPYISWLLLNADSQVLAERWSSNGAFPAGSLVKPFLAIAWGAQHGGAFPYIHCLGSSSRCWLPSGHGALCLEDAIAQSCNAYFLALAADLNRTRAQETLSAYGLRTPTEESPGEALVGLGSDWTETPLTIARAYLSLAAELSYPWQDRILAGMLASADRGTARAVDAALGRYAALAKTGTAPCSHSPKASADGFTIALYPADQPRLILLTRLHGATGAETAVIAGAMLRSLGAGRR